MSSVARHLAIIVTGPWQVGKTTLVRHITQSRWTAARIRI